jgi:hypothetical protein
MDKTAHKWALGLSVLCLIVNSALFGATVVLAQRAAILQEQSNATGR